MTALGFVSGALAALLVYRRAGGRRSERVDVYFEDGSMVSLGAGSPAAERLLPLVRTLLERADGGAA